MTTHGHQPCRALCGLLSPRDRGVARSESLLREPQAPLKRADGVTLLDQFPEGFLRGLVGHEFDDQTYCSCLIKFANVPMTRVQIRACCRDQRLRSSKPETCGDAVVFAPQNCG